MPHELEPRDDGRLVGRAIQVVADLPRPQAVRDGDDRRVRRYAARALSFELHPDREGLDARSDAILLRQETIARLGNLTLVHYGVNRSLQNSAFAAKRKALFDHSNLHLNRQLMQLDTWDEQGIAARGEALADLALKIRPGPV